MLLTLQTALQFPSSGQSEIPTWLDRVGARSYRNLKFLQESYGKIFKHTYQKGSSPYVRMNENKYLIEYSVSRDVFLKVNLQLMFFYNFI